MCLACAHRDIKLENTLIDNTTKLIKITDFGYAKRTNQDSMPKSNVGTQNYAGADALLATKSTANERLICRGALEATCWCDAFCFDVCAHRPAIKHGPGLNPKTLSPKVC